MAELLQTNDSDINWLTGRSFWRAAVKSQNAFKRIRAYVQSNTKLIQSEIYQSIAADALAKQGIDFVGHTSHSVTKITITMRTHNHIIQQIYIPEAHLLTLLIKFISGMDKYLRFQ